MFFLLSVVIAAVGSGLAFRWARNMTTRRLRYVDMAHSRVAPLIAGCIAGVLVLPFSVVPLLGAVVGLGTAVAVGIGTGLGVASASRAIRVASYHLDR